METLLLYFILPGYLTLLLYLLIVCMGMSICKHPKLGTDEVTNIVFLSVFYPFGISIFIVCAIIATIKAFKNG